ncbi:multicopper oxidase LPR1-like [Prosopis cineraria]|uniref:multicopper oxidase LPR1-like n=1 Tax=Prosopis cineraria TaxID=364024 RepID=UPI002410672B|nr:multicopper oxidase LPR1-like [Prosopis cineraria]
MGRSRWLLMKLRLISVLFEALVIISLSAASSRDEELVDSSKLEMFVDEVPDMPRIHGYKILHGVPKPKSLVIGMFKKNWKFHRDLPPTPVFAYGVDKHSATVPGPTIEALHGVDTYVTWQNHLPSCHILQWDPTIPTAIPHSKKGIPTVVHLHGGIHEPQSDGNPNAWFTAGFNEMGPTWMKKTFHYHNNQHPGDLWYHDHALGLTRVNLLAGLIGTYIIRHPLIEDPLGLPHDIAIDRPLMIFDRSFHIDGSLYMNSTGNIPAVHPFWQPIYNGNVIVVNGKVWPRMTVQRRKYRFRIINASNSRFFRFFFLNGLQFTIVASDSAYIEEPVMMTEVLVGPSEIIDMIVDFSQSKSDTIILANNAPYHFPFGDPVDEANGKVMKFFIQPDLEVDKSRIPKKLIKYPDAKLSSVLHTRYIRMFGFGMGKERPTHLYLNAKPFESPVTETPEEGSTEVWYVINLTMANHPFHIHLGLLKVLDQTELLNFEEFNECMRKHNNVTECHMEEHANGQKIEVPAHERGWKVVHKMIPKFVTKIVVRFGYIHTNASYGFDATAEPGYVYHCHMLNHEDNEMIRPLKLTKRGLYYKGDDGLIDSNK